AALVVLGGSAPTAARADVYVQTNLVSNVPGLAPRLDANLRNPWGVSLSTGSPFWVSNQVTGTSTLYNGSGTPQALVVKIPNQSGNQPNGPTGQVFNNTSDSLLTNGTKASFIFANLDGTISGWNNGLGTNAEIHVIATSPTVYTGLAIGNTGTASFLYAADTRNGKIDVFDGKFTKVTAAGGFTDPNLPSGFTPYNIQNLGGTLYVTYENPTSGGGVVNAFDLTGK